MKNSRYKISKRVLIFWTLFIGFGAVAGALWMIIDPSGKSMGMDGLLPYFQVLPFAETLFSRFNLFRLGVTCCKRHHKPYRCNVAI